MWAGASSPVTASKVVPLLSVRSFATVAAMKAATSITAGNLVLVADGGSWALYLVQTAAVYAATPDETHDHTLSTGDIARLVSADESTGTIDNPSYIFGKYGGIDSAAKSSFMFGGYSTFPNKLGINNSKPVTDPSLGARAADAGYTPGVANLAAILAGYDNVNNALAGLIASQHSILYTGADHASIFGGSLHTIETDCPYSTILGGTGNWIESRGRYASIICSEASLIETGATDAEAGFRSTIIGSLQSVAGGRNAVILGGVSNRIDGTYSAIINGESVTIGLGDHVFASGNGNALGASSSASYSAVFGLDNTVDGSRSLVIGEGNVIGAGHDRSTAIGYRCVTPQMGTHLRSTRQRGGVAGNNQSLSFTCSQETTDGVTAVRLSIVGSSNYPKQPENSVVNGTFHVTGVDTATGDVASFEIAYTGKRLGAANPTAVHNVTTTKIDEITVAAVPTVVVTSSGIYRVQVAGKAATNIAWDAVFCGQQVVYTP